MLSSLLDRIRRALQSLPQISAADLLTMACWSGIVFGLAEGVNAVIRRRIHHLPDGQYTWTELIWLPPLVAVAGLALLAIAAILVDRVLRTRGLLLRVASPLLIALSVFGLIRSLRPGIAGTAALVLALGCAVAFARLPATLLQRVRHGARWQLPLVMGALALWAVGVPRFKAYQEQRAREALPVAAQDVPNVLLIIWDTARALSLSLHGHTRKTTPELERFAKSGIVFEHAFATSSWSLPSHASIYTGRDAHEFNVGRDDPLDERYPTLAEALARYGFVTGGFTGNLFYGSSDFGLARGFSWYDAEAPMSAQKLASMWSITRRYIAPWRRWKGDHEEIVVRPASELTEKLLKWVDRRGSRPFFASVNYFEAHEPYLAPAPFSTAFSPTRGRYWQGEQRPTDPALLRELEMAYETCILYVDHELGRLLASLRERGLLDNTLVIVTADHGEQFGDHGAHLFGHERSLYASVLRVPLVMVYPPRVPRGVRRGEVVSIRDIPATVVDALGLSAREHFPGISLLRYATGTVSDADAATPRLGHLRPSRFFTAELEWANRAQHRFSAASGTLHYLVNASGDEELYDFVQDPWETKDLAYDGALAPALNRFRAMLDSAVPDSMHPGAIACHARTRRVTDTC